MSYVHVVDGELLAWGLSPAALQRLAPEGVTFPADQEVFEQLDLSEFGFLKCQETARPDHDANISACQQIAPILQDGSWVQQWEVIPLPVEVLQQQKEARRRAAIPLFAFRKKLIDQQPAVEAAFTALEPRQRRMMKLRWDMQPEVTRNSPLAEFVTATLKLTEEQLDAIFGDDSTE
jgi:hypothetical protein